MADSVRPALALDGGTPVLPEARHLAAAERSGARGTAKPLMPTELGAAITARIASGCASSLANSAACSTWLCSSGTIAVELALRGLKIGPATK